MERQAPLKPALAASLILIDRSGNEPLFLMGRRSVAHVFMPNKYVFPGGRTDVEDHLVKTPHQLAKSELVAMHRLSKCSKRRAHALALSAIRETYEETGLLIGLPHNFQASSPHYQIFEELHRAPNLSALRLIARAITPPGHKRRFDTCFFACFRDETIETEHKGGDELENLSWHSHSQSRNLDLPDITRSIVSDVSNRLIIDPTLQSTHEIPTYRQRFGRYVRSVI